MVRFKFFVHCTGWKDGGYENTHFAHTATEAKRIVDNWNANGQRVTLLSVEPISSAEFAADYIC
jgi:hypothetical protein